MTLELAMSLAALVVLPLLGMVWKNLNDKVQKNADKIDSIPSRDIVLGLERDVKGIGKSIDELRDQTRSEFKEIADKFALKEDVKDFKNEMKRDIEKLNVKIDELLTEVRANAMTKKGR